MTTNGITTTKAAGQEQYEVFKRKVGRKTKEYIQYDYRHTDGVLFSCVKPTLEVCRAARDEWIAEKYPATVTNIEYIEKITIAENVIYSDAPIYIERL